MAQPKGLWLEDEKRRAQIQRPAGSTYFGYEPIGRSEKSVRVRKHFESVARHYDFMNTLLSLGIHYAWKRTAVRMLDLRPGQKVLDVCGGTGDLALLAAARAGRQGRIIVYDINRAMLAAGDHKIKQRPLGSCIALVQGDAENISFPDSHFDAAMVGFGIRNVTDIRRGFAEMHRVLAPGGKMMCLEFSKPTAPVFRWLYDIYSFHAMPLLGELIAGSRQAYTHLPESIRMFPLPDELSAMLSDLGFTNITYRRLTNGIAVVHLATKP
jgi:demethylmenaquinone methyltransferase/2-methoxy-6-polyprenyl-1,4-benzoquinol methylase